MVFGGDKKVVTDIHTGYVNGFVCCVVKLNPIVFLEVVIYIYAVVCANFIDSYRDDTGLSTFVVAECFVAGDKVYRSVIRQSISFFCTNDLSIVV